MQLAVVAQIGDKVIMSKSPTYRLRVAAIVLAVSMGSAGCTKTFLNAEDEARIGAQQHPHIVKQFGGAYDEPKVTAYVERVMARIAKASDKPDAFYKITILDTPVVNAFALPGGYTYVTRGLLALAGSEAELAGVIGHEIAHVTARHGARRHTANVGTQIVAGVLGIALKVGAGINPKATGDLVNIGSAALIAGYSRENEYEADNLGIQAMARAGYRPHAQADFLAKMARFSAYQSGSKAKSSWLSTHPNNKERVAKAYEKATARATPSSIYQGVESYLAAIDGMAYGDPPTQGIVRGQSFAHADLKLGFKVPRGFVLNNAATRVTAKHANGVQIIFDMDARIANEPPDDYLRGGWADDAQLTNPRVFTLDGRAAASGQVRTEKGIALLLAIAEDESERFLRFGVIAPRHQIAAAEAAMAALKRQIRFLSSAEAARIKPYRIKIATVQSGDSLSSLARLMRGTNEREALFRLLNNSEGKALSRGQKVKLIAE